MRRLLEVARYAVIIPSAASVIGAIVLMILGSIEIVRSALDVVLEQVPLKETVVSILTSVDAILLGTVLLVIGYGLYELFVDTNLEVPDWLEITTLDDFKKFIQATSQPILANITEFGMTPLFTRDELAASGVRMILYPLSAFRAMNKAAENVYEAIRRDGTQAGVLGTMQTREELYQSIDYYKYEERLDKLDKDK